MKLAYVEDDEDARTLFLEQLSEEGFTGEGFGDAEDFLRVAAPGGYDLLIIDIRLPKMDGVKLLRRLRDKGIFTPAILITAFNSLEYTREALNSSANYLLEKPFSFAALKRVIAKVLNAPRLIQDCVDRGLGTLALTRREAEVARLILKGLSNKEIADVAQISEQTVKQYITQIFEKAHVKSRGEFFSSVFPV